MRLDESRGARATCAQRKQQSERACNQCISERVQRMQSAHAIGACEQSTVRWLAMSSRSSSPFCSINSSVSATRSATFTRRCCEYSKASSPARCRCNCDRTASSGSSSLSDGKGRRGDGVVHGLDRIRSDRTEPNSALVWGAIGGIQPGLGERRNAPVMWLQSAASQSVDSQQMLQTLEGGAGDCTLAGGESCAQLRDDGRQGSQQRASLGRAAGAANQHTKRARSWRACGAITRGRHAGFETLRLLTAPPLLARR